MSDNSGQNDQSMEEILGSIRKIISEDNAQSGTDAGPAGEAGGDEEILDPTEEVAAEEEILDLTEEVSAEEVEADRLEPILAVVGAETPDDLSEPDARREPILGLHAQEAPEEVAEQPVPAPALEEAAAAVPPRPLVMPSAHQSTEISPETMQEPEREQAPEVAEASMDEESVEQPAPAILEKHLQEIVSESATSATATALGELTRVMEEKTNKLKVGPGEISIADMVKELIRPMLREWLDENLPGIVERVVHREIQKLVDRAETED
ncbi:MAG: DUF2497 domain-containing protein [Alphaproteobacteria bacterium]|nr:DUF2497 domain-containing protein [Alphaproteobacteria bacterium]